MLFRCPGPAWGPRGDKGAVLASELLVGVFFALVMSQHSLKCNKTTLLFTKRKEK